MRAPTAELRLPTVSAAAAHAAAAAGAGGGLHLSTALLARALSATSAASSTPLPGAASPSSAVMKRALSRRSGDRSKRASCSTCAARDCTVSLLGSRSASFTAKFSVWYFTCLWHIRRLQATATLCLSIQALLHEITQLAVAYTADAQLVKWHALVQFLASYKLQSLCYHVATLAPKGSWCVKAELSAYSVYARQGGWCAEVVSRQMQRTHHRKSSDCRCACNSAGRRSH
eukprot:5202-Heterococcus_DN1.PRE.1